MYLQLIGMCKQEPDSPGQIFAGCLRAGPIDQGKSVVSLLGERKRMGKLSCIAPT